MDVNVLAICLLLVELAVEVGGNVIPFIIFNHLQFNHFSEIVHHLSLSFLIFHHLSPSFTIFRNLSPSFTCTGAGFLFLTFGNRITLGTCWPN